MNTSPIAGVRSLIGILVLLMVVSFILPLTGNAYQANPSPASTENPQIRFADMTATVTATPTAIDAVAKNWYHYDDQKFGYSLRYPPTWVKQPIVTIPPTIDEHVMLRQVEFTDSKQHTSVFVRTWPRPDGQGVEAWWQSIGLPQFASPNVQPVSQTATLDGSFVIISYPKAGVVARWIVVAAAHGDFVTLLEFFAPLSNTTEADFRVMLESVNWSSTSQTATFLSEFLQTNLPGISYASPEDALRPAVTMCCGVNSPGNPFPCNSVANNGNCTWWAYHKRPDIPCRGNADTWASCARGAGYRVDGEPRDGDIIVYPNGNGTYSQHVAYLERVNSTSDTNLDYTMSQMSWGYSASNLCNESRQNGTPFREIQLRGTREFIHKRGNEPPPSPTPTSPPPPPSTPTLLKLYWSPERGDALTVATAAGEADANAAHYRLVRPEGFVFPTQRSGTVPLDLFFSPERADNFTVATDAGRAQARAAGYGLVRTEGYVFPTQQPGTVPLKLFYNAARRNNITIATAEGEADALAAGYQFVRIEGYVTPIAALKLYWQAERADALTNATAAGEADANAAHYDQVRSEGFVFATQQSGTVPLKLFYNAERVDNLSVATQQGEADALAAGYGLVRVEGYVFSTEQPGTVPLKLFYNPGRRNNITVATAEGEADALVTGYQFVRIEGYVYPDNRIVPLMPAPLKLYWNRERLDNFTVATAMGETDAYAANYQLVRSEGFAFPTHRPGTVPLKLFYNGERADNLTVATQQGEADARAAGYGLVRIEGYVYPTQQTGTVPLKLFWNPARGDNITVATAVGEASARAAGYELVRIEGYGVPIPVLQLYWHTGRRDSLTVATDAGKADARAAGYELVRSTGEGYVLPYQYPGTVPLKLFYNAERVDNFTTATVQGQADAIAAGYGLVRIEGYVYPTQQIGTVPLKLFWNSALSDNITIATAAGEESARTAGYKFIRVEGYVFPSPQVAYFRPTTAVVGAPGSVFPFKGGGFPFNSRATVALKEPGNENYQDIAQPSLDGNGELAFVLPMSRNAQPGTYNLRITVQPTGTALAEDIVIEQSLEIKLDAPLVGGQLLLPLIQRSPPIDPYPAP